MKKKGFYKWYKKRLKRMFRSLRELHQIEIDNPTVQFEEDIKIIKTSGLHLGKYVYIGKGTILDCGSGEWCNNRGKITIGDYTRIGPYSVLLGAGEIEIGKKCQIAPGAMIIAQSLDPKVIYDPSLIGEKTPQHKFGKVTLGDAVLVGAGVIILEGVTIGDGTVIAAGSCIQKDVPPNSFVITGKTGKFIDKRSSIFRPK